MARLFVTGIGTGIGKTLLSAILCEAMQADYWKPVQAGGLEKTDSMTVKALISNDKTKIHDETYLLKAAMSPRAAADLESRTIDPQKFIVPSIARDIIVEGAGGVLVPLSREFMVIDLISQLDCQVVLLSKNYLGSINHTLLTVEALNKRKIPILGLVFNGPPNEATESIIRERTELRFLGRIDEETTIDSSVVSAYAAKFRQVLHFVLRRKESDF